MAKKKAAKSKTVKPAVKSDPLVKAAAEKRPIDAYTHGDKRRTNNPPVGLVTPQNDPSDPPKKTYAFDPHLDPQLVWAGKAERTSLEVPSISLHVHERIDPKSIIAAVRSNGDHAKSDDHAKASDHAAVSDLSGSLSPASGERERSAEASRVCLGSGRCLRSRRRIRRCGMRWTFTSIRTVGRTGWWRGTVCW